MRDRLTELLPLLLVGAILLVFQFIKTGGPNLAFLPLASPSPTPEPLTRSVEQTTASRPGAGVTIITCDSTQPRFIGKMAKLKAALGSSMGKPVDCEHSVDGDGNTQQTTTTGLAYYRKQRDAACFTTGWDHWAFERSRGLIHWAGDDVDPPLDAVIIGR